MTVRTAPEALSEAPTGDPAAPVFPVLDSLRAVGALAVLTTHVGFYAGEYGDGTWGAFLARLDIGVALFFVLSGFLLSRPFLDRAARGRTRPRVRRYLWKRVLRVVPVYVVAVVAALLLLDENSTTGPRDWIVTLTFATTFVDPLPPAGLSQMWSLGVEMTFYLALPLIMLLATGRRWRPMRVLAVIALMVILCVWWHLEGARAADRISDGPPLQWLPAYLTWFAMGIALALAHVVRGHGGSPRAAALAARVLDLGRQPGTCWTLAAGLMLVATTTLAGPVLLEPASPAQSLTKNLLYALIGALLVLTGIGAEGSSRFARVFSARPARHLGITSYSLFCVHLLILDLVAPALGYDLFEGHFWRLWAITLGASLIAAEVAYRLVERPTMRLKDLRWPARRIGSATSGTSAR